MNCNRIQSLLSAYADRELSGVEMFLVRQHIHECDCCQAEEAELRRVRAVLSSLEIPTPSPDFENRLLSAVFGGQPAPAERRRNRWSSGIAAVGLSAAAAVCFIYGVRTTPRSANSHNPIAAPPSVTSSTGESASISLERDSALINSSDPLAGPQVALAASYGRP
jgi:anti-sigma factor RsiW